MTSFQDYSEHVVALQALTRELAKALRDKEYTSADKLTAEAMKRLARIHGWLAAKTRADDVRLTDYFRANP